MHAFCVSCKNSQQIDEKIADIAKQSNAFIHEFDLKKVSDLKRIKEFTKLKWDTFQLLKINQLDESSIEAQNAFLKTLEEPQEKIIFAIAVKNHQKLIQTILSRVSLIELKDKSNTDEVATNEAVFFLKQKSSEKIQTISKITKREDATKFLQNLTQYITHNIDPKSAAYLEEITNSLTNIEKNANVQLELTKMVVKLKRANG